MSFPRTIGTKICSPAFAGPINRVSQTFFSDMFRRLTFKLSLSTLPFISTVYCLALTNPSPHSLGRQYVQYVLSWKTVLTIRLSSHGPQRGSAARGVCAVEARARAREKEGVKVETN